MIALSIEVETLHWGRYERSDMCPKNWPGCGVSPDGLFHRRRGADNSGPTVLNANVVAVQNATKVSYMGKQPLHVTTLRRRLTSKPNHSRWKSPGFKVSRVTNLECVVAHSHDTSIVQTLENDTMSSLPVRRPRHTEARANIGPRELGRRRHSW